MLVALRRHKHIHNAWHFSHVLQLMRHAPKLPPPLCLVLQHTHTLRQGRRKAEGRESVEGCCKHTPLATSTDELVAGVILVVARPCTCKVQKSPLSLLKMECRAWKVYVYLMCCLSYLGLYKDIILNFLVVPFVMFRH